MCTESKVGSEWYLKIRRFASQYFMQSVVCPAMPCVCSELLALLQFQTHLVKDFDLLRALIQDLMQNHHSGHKRSWKQKKCRDMRILKGFDHLNLGDVLGNQTKSNKQRWTVALQPRHIGQIWKLNIQQIIHHLVQVLCILGSCEKGDTWEILSITKHTKGLNLWILWQFLAPGQRGQRGQRPVHRASPMRRSKSLVFP